MASYNKEKYIQETIDSVVAQSLPNFELIIVDDFSNDSTIELIKQNNKNDSRIKLIENKQNHGANYCRNRALQIAKGDYVMFIDADDIININCLENRYTKTKEFPDANLLVFTMGVFTKQVGDDQRLWRPISKNPLIDFLQHELPWSILQPIWKKDFLIGLGGFDETFQRLQDVELNTRALLSPEVKYKLFDEAPDCYYRIDEERKNFSAYQFLERWVNAAILYVKVFSITTDKLGLRNSLNGTIFQTHLQTMFYYKSKRLVLSEFKELESRLFSVLKERGSRIHYIIFHISKFYNLYMPRIPGMNRMLKYLVVL